MIHSNGERTLRKKNDSLHVTRATSRPAPLIRLPGKLRLHLHPSLLPSSLHSSEKHRRSAPSASAPAGEGHGGWARVRRCILRLQGFRFLLRRARPAGLSLRHQERHPVLQAETKLRDRSLWFLHFLLCRALPRGEMHAFFGSLLFRILGKLAGHSVCLD